MRRDQIDRRRRPFAIAGKEIAGGGEALGEVTQRHVLLQPETARGIAKMVVPFGKQRREVPHLITALANIPGFGNQLERRQYRVAANGLKQRRVLTKFRRTPHHRRQVEAKTIDVAFINPKAQALQCILHHARMTEVERVTAAGPVVIIAVVPDPIIAAVIDTAQGDCRPFKIDFRAMVQHDIEDHLDARRVQRLHRIAELIERPLRLAGVARLQRKQRQRVVAPVVAQPHPLQARFAGELRHRHQLQRGNTQTAKIIDHQRVAQRLIGAADRLRQLRMQPGQPFDVGFINDRFAPRRARRFITEPVVMQIDHLGFWRNGCAIAGIRLIHTAMQTLVVQQFARHLMRARVEQQLGRIEAMPLRRIPRPVHPITVA